MRCDGSLAWRLLHVVLAAAAAASLTAWAVLHGDAGAPAAGASSAAAALLAGVCAWYTTRSAPAGLGWDGQRWTLDGVHGQVDVMIDLGPWMLLRYRPPAGAARWLPLPDAGGALHGLRTALYARGSASGDPAAPPAPGSSV